MDSSPPIFFFFFFGNVKHLFLSQSHWTLSFTLWYVLNFDLFMSHFAYKLFTAAQFVSFLWSFRQSVYSRILHLSHATKKLLSVVMSFCFHTAPSSWYSDGSLGRMYTAKCCYRAGEKACWSTTGMKMYRLSSALKITGIFCAPLQFLICGFHLSRVTRKAGLCSCFCVFALSAEPS